jgi:hypothetical protein
MRLQYNEELRETAFENSFNRTGLEANSIAYVGNYVET